MPITFLCPAPKNHPSGGVKVIYRYAEILAAHGVPSSVFHPDDPTYRYPWFESGAEMRANGRFDAADDFVVIPEVWAGRFAPTFYENGLKYAIFVQGGYSMTLALGASTQAELEAAYEKASILLSISDDTSEVITLAFPRVRDKIMRIHPYVGDKYHPGEKSKLITFMPRKLPDQGHLLRFLLDRHLTARGWAMKAIHGKTEIEVAEMLGRSSIFLAIAYQEGFALPPFEAAMAGAIVVGYSGQGAREYFRPPVLREIENGNMRAFVAGVLQAMDDADAGMLTSAPFQNVVGELRGKYSAANELKDLLAFAGKARELQQI